MYRVNDAIGWFHTKLPQTIVCFVPQAKSFCLFSLPKTSNFQRNPFQSDFDLDSIWVCLNSRLLYLGDPILWVWKWFRLISCVKDYVTIKNAPMYTMYMVYLVNLTRLDLAWRQAGTFAAAPHPIGWTGCMSIYSSKFGSKTPRSCQLNSHYTNGKCFQPIKFRFLVRA